MTRTGFILLLPTLSAGFVAFIYSLPIHQALILLGVIGAIILAAFTVDDGGDRPRLASLAAGRQGESICSFARSFDCRAVDTWVIRAVFEELQPYCRFGRGTLPLRPSDDLVGVLCIDEEELDELAEDIADRAGRSMEGCVDNPLYGNVKSVSDLVMFLVKQPRHPQNSIR